MGGIVISYTLTRCVLFNGMTKYITGLSGLTGAIDNITGRCCL